MTVPLYHVENPYFIDGKCYKESMDSSFGIVALKFSHVIA